MRVGGAVKKELEPTRRIIQLDNSLFIRYVTAIRSFLQSEVTQLQKWMVSVFSSTAAHFVH